MAISIDYNTLVITVPKADTTLVSAGPPEIRELDVDWFRLQLKALEAAVDGMAFLDTHAHNTTVTVGGVTLARVVEIINGYTVTFENGSYAVNLVGANNNISDVTNLNNVSIRSANSAGLANVRQVETLLYEGVVTIDTKNGNPGITGTRGSRLDPVDNLADALTIAGAINSRKFELRGNLTLTQALSDWVVEGIGEEAEVNLNGQDVADSEFSKVKLSGTMSNGPIRTTRCELDGITGIYGLSFEDVLLPTANQMAGDWTLIHPSSGVAGISAPIADMNGGAYSLSFRGINGGIDIRNVTSASAKVSVDGTGQVILGATNTDGDWRISGNFKLTNTSSIPTGQLELKGLVNFDNIWNGYNIP